MKLGKGQRLKLTGIALVAVTLVALFLFVPGLGKDKALDWVKGLPTSGFVVAFVILPLWGVPISLFLVLAGLKFGLAKGLVMAAGCMFFHNVVAYWFTHSFLKDRIKRFLKDIGYNIPHVPKRHQIWFTAAFTGIPGIPYAPKLYLLALTNIPFRIYLWIGWPIYSLSNIVYIGLAGAAVDIDWKWITLLIVVGVATLALSFWLKKRLDRKLRTEDGEKSPEPSH